MNIDRKFMKNGLEGGMDASLKEMIMHLFESVGDTVFKRSGALDDFIAKRADGLVGYQFDIGIYLRNNALAENSPLYGKFIESGIHEKDEMSSLIIRVWHTELNKRRA